MSKIFPKEIFREILNYCDLDSLCAFSRTSKEMRKLVFEPAITFPEFIKNWVSGHKNLAGKYLFPPNIAKPVLSLTWTIMKWINVWTLIEFKSRELILYFANYHESPKYPCLRPIIQQIFQKAKFADMRKPDSDWYFYIFVILKINQSKDKPLPLDDVVCLIKMLIIQQVVPYKKIYQKIFLKINENFQLCFPSKNAFVFAIRESYTGFRKIIKSGIRKILTYLLEIDVELNPKIFDYFAFLLEKI